MSNYPFKNEDLIKKIEALKQAADEIHTELAELDTYIDNEMWALLREKKVISPDYASGFKSEIEFLINRLIVALNMKDELQNHIFKDKAS